MKIKEAVIVEGKYDKMRLKDIIDTTIIETNGFRIFKDKEKLNLIKKLADSRGILILTDSDSAGFVIRNYLKGVVPPDKIKHAYIPQIKGKEKRKEKPSKEGTLGVEGLDEDTLKEVLKKSGVICIDTDNKPDPITRQDLFSLGLTGRDNSKILRTKLLKKLNLPTYLSTKALTESLNGFMTLKELKDIMKNI